MNNVRIFDDRPCQLGEGPLWHPERRQLFWFDITARKLLTRTTSRSIEWQFEEHFSAAGWIDYDTLVTASETGLWRFRIDTGELEKLIDIEADIISTRSNDGRTDPHGGFWIGTMGKKKESGAGTIYRYFDGHLASIVRDLTIPNSICFSPNGRRAYYCDTPTACILELALDEKGWPVSKPRIFADLSDEGLYPDGSVVDVHGAIWNAQWGESRIARYLPDGSLSRTLFIPAPQCSCPAFGGTALDRLFVTTAREDMSAETILAFPLSGQTFVAETGFQGLAVPAVRLGRVKRAESPATDLK